MRQMCYSELPQSQTPSCRQKIKMSESFSFIGGYNFIGKGAIMEKKRYDGLKKSLPLAALVFSLPQAVHHRKRKIYDKKRSRLCATCDSPVEKEERRGDVIDVILRSPIDGFGLSCTLYPHDDARGVVQVIHGIHEHKGRYEHFARFLHSHGFAVAVSDTRGHGRSVGKRYPRGFMGAYQQLRDDQYTITGYLKSIYPDKPFSLFAHSLGSLIARAYIQEYDSEIDKLILCGTVMYYRPVGAAVSLLRFIEFYTNISKWLRWDFLFPSSEEDILKKIDEDPDYMHSFQISELMTIFELDRAICDTRSYKRQNLNLSILSISGEYDYLVTGGKCGISATMNLLSQIGYKNMISIVYPNMFHEILKDPDREDVYKDILHFLIS